MDNGNDKTHLAVYIRVDKAYDIYERKVYGLGEMFGEVGGFKEIVLIIGSIFVLTFQSTMFNSSLLRKVY
jgi:hypothetical protein